MSKASNERKRARLHVEQGGICYYCQRPIGFLVGSLNNPALEHYIPRSKGGKKLVLACEWCDKKKGMIPGPVFEEIMKRRFLDTALSFDEASKGIAAECKKIHMNLLSQHPPNRMNGEQAKRDHAWRLAKIEASRQLWAGAHYMNFTDEEPGEPCAEASSGV